MAHKFFVSQENIKDEQVYITGENVKHMSKVLRLVVDDPIVIADGHGKDYHCVLTELTKEYIKARIINRVENQNQREAKLKVTLLQSIPKGDKMELIIQKCTELGIERIMPVVTERTIVQLDKKKAMSRVERWQKIAEEACKQCQRSIIPTIMPILKLEEALKSLDTDCCLIPWEEEKEISLRKVMQSKKNQLDTLAFLIGPEGGLSSEEIQLVRAYGGQTVTLGQRILRTETAGLATLTMILYETGDLGGN